VKPFDSNSEIALIGNTYPDGSVENLLPLGGKFVNYLIFPLIFKTENHIDLYYLIRRNEMR